MSKPTFFKIISVGVLALALAVFTGGVAQAITTINANAVTNDGALTITGGAASTWSTSVGALTLTSAAAATWSTAAGALTITGTGGLTLDSATTTAVNLGTAAAAKTITIGNAASTLLDLNAISVDIDGAATGVTIDALDAGTVNLGTSTDAASDTSAVNIGTSATARTITVGAAESTILDLNAISVDIDGAATGVTIDALDAGTLNMGTSTAAASDTSAINIGTSATARTITVGAAESTILDLNAISVDIDGAATGVTIDALDAGSVNLGTSTNAASDGAAVNVGTGGARTVTIGNNTGATAVNVTTGTGGSLLSSAVTTGQALQITAASLTTGRALYVNSGNGAAADTAGGISTVLIASTNTQGTAAQTSGSGLSALRVNFTQNPTIAGNTENVAIIQNQATSNATDTAIASLLLLDNADTDVANSTIITDALLITNSGGIATGITDAIDVTATDIVNAINVGTNTILGTTGAIDFSYFDVAATTGAVTLTQQTAGTAPFTVTGVDDGTAAILDLNVHNVSGTLIDVDYTAETQTGDLTGLDLNLNTNLTAAADQDVTGVNVQTPVLTAADTAVTTTYTGYNISAAGALDVTEGANAAVLAWRGLNITMPAIDSGTGDTVTATGILISAGTVTDGLGTETSTGIDATDSDLGAALSIGANTILSTGTVTFNRADSGTITLTAIDNDANADLTVSSGGTGILTLDAGGAGSIVVGSADVTKITAIVDNDVTIQNGATGNVTLDFRDYADTTDDDMAHAILTVNCTNTGSGTENCDFTVGVVEAGAAAETRLNIDADGGITIGSANNNSVTISTDGTGDGEVVLPAQSVGESELVASSGTGLGVLRVARAKYDFATDTGTQGTKTPTLGATLPDNAVMVAATINSTTAVTSGGAATVSVGTSAGSSATSILGATAIASLSADALLNGVPVFATPVKLTAAGAITFTIGTADLTAGVIEATVFYYVAAN